MFLRIRALRGRGAASAGDSDRGPGGRLLGRRPRGGVVTDHGHPALVEVRDVAVEFRVSARYWRAKTQQLRAVDGVTFDLRRGETLALVGESGCGKTTIGRTLLRLYEPVAGEIRFDGQNLASLAGEEARHFRRRAQMIFQDPYASLNPRMKVEEVIAEPLRAHGLD